MGYLVIISCVELDLIADAIFPVWLSNACSHRCSASTMY